jgi:hypothetical protein
VEHVPKVLLREESFKEAGQNFAIETGTAAERDKTTCLQFEKGASCKI